MAARKSRIRPWKPQPLRVTEVLTLEQIRAAKYVRTAGFGSIEQADSLDLRRVRRGPSYPPYDGRLSRLGWWGDKPVGHVGVMHVTLQMGRSRLPVAGISGVATDPRARKHGVASALMRAALEASRKAGLGFSLLFGIPDFYHRFGFVPAWATPVGGIETARMPKAKPWRARKAKSADFAAMTALYHSIYGNFYASALRTPECFALRKQAEKVILTEPNGNGWAYVTWGLRKQENKPDLLEVFETAGKGRQWPAAVVEWVRRKAEALKTEKVHFILPAEHPVIGFLRFFDFECNFLHYRNRGAMVAVLDFEVLARQMAKEWSHRIEAAAVRIPSDGLTVQFRDEYFAWWPNRLRQPVRKLPSRPTSLDIRFNDALARLVMCYGPPAEVMAHYDIKASARAKPALLAIFAERNAGFSRMDHF